MPTAEAESTERKYGVWALVDAWKAKAISINVTNLLPAAMVLWEEAFMCESFCLSVDELSNFKDRYAS